MANKEQITVADTGIDRRRTSVFKKESTETNQSLGGDDALQVFVNHDQVNFVLTEATNKTLLRKIDLMLMPVSLVSVLHDAEVELPSYSSWCMV